MEVPGSHATSVRASEVPALEPPPLEGVNLSMSALSSRDQIVKQYEEERLDIISLMRWKKLRRIKNDFFRNEQETNSKGLTQRQFVKVMLQYLPDYQDPAVLIQNLIQLFKQIDVNDDGTLEWEEFSNHLIELGMVKKDRAFLDAIKNYRPSDLKDLPKHDTEIEHMYFLEKLKHLLVMQRDSRKFKIYNTKNGKFLYEAPGNTGAVIGADYIPEKNLVATSANNNSISFWEPGNVYMFRNSISTNDIQMVVKWDDSTQRLFSGGCDNVIHSYDLEEMKSEKTRESMQKYKGGHTGDIMDLLPIQSQKLLVSCSMDKTICLWSLKDLELKKQLEGPAFGIYSLAWSNQQNCLLSAGLDHDIFIWNIYVEKRTQLLKGHNHSLVGVRCLPGTHQIVSADISGMFRIWDDRTMSTIQAFNCSLNQINCFTMSAPPKRIIAAGKRLVFYDYDEPTDQHLSDESAPIAVLYNSVFYTFITAHAKCVKIWDATSGELTSVFRDITSKEITAICMDSRERKLFIGTQKGKVFAINIKNGVKMKKFKKHGKDTSAFCYWPQKKRLISASWDGVVRIHDDTDPSVGPSRYKFKFHQKTACNSVSFNPLEEVVASASDDKTVVIANLNTYRHEATLDQHDSEVKVVLFLTPFDALVSADLSGSLYFYAVAPSRRRNQLLIKIKDDIESEVGGIENFPFRALAFDNARYLLFTGDEMGHIHKWDLTQFIFKLQKLSRGNVQPQMPPLLFSQRQEYYQSRPVTHRNQVRESVDSVIIHATPHQPQPGANPFGERLDGNLLDIGGGDTDAFLTGLRAQEQKTSRLEEIMNIEFEEDDIKLVKRWKGHTDGINQVCFVEEPESLATCSFDGNVKIWSLNGDLLGSLVLGKGPEWKLKVNKQDRIREEREAARKLYEEIKNVSYKEMIENKANISKKRDKQQGSNALLNLIDQVDQENEKARYQEGEEYQDSEEDFDIPLSKESVRQLETLQQMEIAQARQKGLKPKASTLLWAKYTAMQVQIKKMNKQDQIIKKEKDRREAQRLRKEREIEEELERQRAEELKRQEMLKKQQEEEQEVVQAETFEEDRSQR